MDPRSLKRSICIMLSVLMVAMSLPAVSFATEELSCDAYFFKSSDTSQTVTEAAPEEPLGSVKLNISVSFPQNSGITSTSAIRNISLYYRASSNQSYSHRILYPSESYINGTLKEFSEYGMYITDVSVGAGNWNDHVYTSILSEEHYGTYNLRIETTDDRVFTSTQTFTLKMPENGQSSGSGQGGSTPVNTPPAIQTSGLDSGTVGEAYSAQLSATPGVEGDSIVWALLDGELPDGLTLSPTGSISGTPASSGSFTFTVRASETGTSNGQADKVYTIIIDEPQQPPVDLAFDYGPSVILSWVYGAQDALVRGGEYSCFAWLNRELIEGEYLEGKIEYTDKNDVQTSAAIAIETDGCRVYANGQLPADAKSVNSLKLSINGALAYTENINASIAPELTLRFSGSTADKYLSIISGEETVYSIDIDGLSELKIDTLPAGSYNVEVTQWVSYFGNIVSCADSFTLSEGKELTKPLTLTDHVYTPVYVDESASGVWGDKYWYGDSAGTDLKGTNYYYYLLDDETVYLKLVPRGYDSVFYTETALTPVNKNSGTPDGDYRRIAVSVPAKPKAVVNGSALLEKVDGSGYSSGAYFVTAVRPGDPGYNNTSSVWVSANTAGFSFSDITEGTVITASGNDGIHGSVSHTVTAAEAASGSIDLSGMQIGVADGVIVLDVTGREGTKTWSSNAHGFSSFTLTKADGTVVQASKYQNSLMINDPGSVSAGDVLTLRASSYSGNGFPDYYGEASITMGTRDGKLFASASLILDRRGHVMARWSHTVSYPFVALLYGPDGSLIYTDRNAAGPSSLYGTERFPSVVAGSYTVVFVNRSYLDTLAPEAYDTSAEGKALDYSVSRTASVENGKEAYLELVLPDTAAASGRVNTDVSGVTMSRKYSGLVTLDLNIVPAEGFAPQAGSQVTVIIKTNQNGQTDLSAGYVNTRSLTINGKVFDITRYGSNERGVIRQDGSIVLKLSAAEVEQYGGFPMAISTSFTETVLESVSAEAYVQYTQNDTVCVDFVADCEQVTGSLSLEVPSAVADGSFTVYGRGPASKAGRPYVVTIYADGVKVASVQTDQKKGWYKAKLDLGMTAVENHQTIEFTAFGAYADGSSAYSSRTARCEYTPDDAALKKIDLLWQYNMSDTQMRSITLLDDGDPVNLYKAWYRGGNVNDEGGVQWQIAFDNPDRVESVYVYVPRNGETIELEAKKQGDKTWLTDLTYFPGVAPDGAWVTYDTVATYDVEHQPSGSIDFTSAAKALNKTDTISGMTGSPDSESGLSFTLHNESGGTLAVSMKNSSLSWDTEEFDELKSLSAPDYTLPNIVSYEEGYLAATEGSWGNDIITRFEDDGGKLVFFRETYTAFSRTVTVWSEANQTVEKSVLTLGTSESGNPPVAAGLTGAALQYAMTSALHEIWDAFYDQLGDAARQLASLSESELNSISKSRKIGAKEVYEAAKEISDESYSWAEGAEITATEIRKIKDFLDDNPCLMNTLKFHRSNSDKTDYDVFGEVNAVYYQVGIGWLGKIVNGSTSLPTYLGKPVQEAGKEAIGAIKDGAKDYITDYAKGKIFYRQAENLAHEVFIAAKLAEIREGKSGQGGTCSEGINWSRFPKDLYDYEKEFGKGKKKTKTPAEPQGRYDPSGFIYEAVPSNRLEGAIVTLYQLDGANYSAGTLSGGQAAMTDAEYFGLEPNPQTTGEDGRYQWFVPEGWWRVQAGKSGYSSADTGSDAGYGLDAVLNSTDGKYYMPVLPVQLDVNIGLVSYEAPEVASFSATTEGVLVEFSKYMDETTLLPAAFTLLVGGAEKVIGTDAALTFVDSEASSDSDGAPSYTKTVLITYSGASEGDTLQLAVANSVRSYAGVPMAERYDSGEKTVAAALQTAVPTASASAGQVELNTAVRLSCATTGASIYYTTDGSEPTVSSTLYSSPIIISQDMTVKAIAVKAGMTDSEVLTAAYTVPADSPVTAPAKVVATLNGQTLTDGATVSAGSMVLTTSTEGASIYYTTNGICPKEDPDPILYTGPISLHEGNYYFRIRSKKDGIWSDGLPLHLTVAAAQTGGLDGSTVSTATAGAITGSAVTTPAAVRFIDVPEDSWYAEAVDYVAEHGYFNGVGGDRFAPNDTMNRAMFATVLYRIAGGPEYDGTESFVDVPEDRYFTKAIAWAASESILLGSGGLFRPDDPVTREQMVTILWRYIGSPKASGDLSGFSDAGEISAYAYDAMVWAVSSGLIGGKGGGIIDPKGSAKRSEVAKVVMLFDKEFGQ